MTGARRRRPRLSGTTCSRGAAGGRQGVSEVELGALRAAEQAAARQRRSGTALPFARRASRARPKLGGRRQTTSHLRWRCREASRKTARESSGSLGARAEGRLQKSVRGIFPALSAAPARVTRTGLGSTERPLLVTGEPERAGREGCGASERLPNSDRARARLGSDVEHRADGRRPGPTSRPALTRRAGIGSWRGGSGRDPAQAWARSAGPRETGDPEAGAVPRQRVSEVTTSGAALPAEGRGGSASRWRGREPRHAAPDRSGPKLPR